MLEVLKIAVMQLQGINKEGNARRLELFHNFGTA